MALAVMYGIGCGVSGKTKNAASLQSIENTRFLLSMKGAKIYDLDEEPVDVKRWTELENVRAYYDFFKKHDGEFGH